MNEEYGFFEKLEILWIVLKSWTKVMWCRLFHRRWRKRTGKRRIRRLSICYEVICEKCGTEHTEVVVTINASNLRR